MRSERGWASVFFEIRGIVWGLFFTVLCFFLMRVWRDVVCWIALLCAGIVWCRSGLLLVFDFIVRVGTSKLPANSIVLDFVTLLLLHTPVPSTSPLRGSLTILLRECAATAVCPTINVIFLTTAEAIVHTVKGVN